MFIFFSLLVVPPWVKHTFHLFVELYILQHTNIIYMQFKHDKTLKRKEKVKTRRTI